MSLVSRIPCKSLDFFFLLLLVCHTNGAPQAQTEKGRQVRTVTGELRMLSPGAAVYLGPLDESPREPDVERAEKSPGSL